MTTVTEAALGDEAPLTAEDADRNQALRIGDMVELRFLPSPDGDALQIHVRLVQEATLHVGLARGEQVRQQAWLTRDASETDLFVGVDQALTFFIRDKDDQIQFSMDLGNVLDPH